VRGFLAITLAALGAMAGLTAQEPGTGTLSGVITDTTRRELPGVKVTVVGPVRAEAVTNDDGRYSISDLTPGRYAVTAALPGFGSQGRTVDVRAGHRRTLHLSLPVRCSTDPPLTVLFPFDEMLTMIDAIAHVRIADVESRRELITEQFGCSAVRPYTSQPLRLIDASHPEERHLFRFFGRGWEPPLARGDEAIVFLWRDRAGRYHEAGSRYRLSVRNGHVHPRPDDGSGFADGEAVGVVLNSLRDALRARR
jgi:hypothetical protein